MTDSSPRPQVLVNFAVSLDGKINPAPGHRAGPFVMSRQAEDGRRMKALRARGDAILIGASNLRLDDPDLAMLEADRRLRQERRQAEPYRIVITTRGDGLRADQKIFDPASGGPAVVAHTAAMPEETRQRLRPVARLIELGTDTIAMTHLLEWLARELAVRTLVCEGGGELCAALFAAQAVDQLFVTLTPRVLGGRSAPTLAGGAGLGVDQIPDASLGEIERVGDELFLRYDFRYGDGD
jgi:5-amino-6-(5-phosphoribosylamino)uracil reductase